MNISIRELTPTQRKAVDRRKAFHADIERKAAELKALEKRKAQQALNAKPFEQLISAVSQENAALAAPSPAQCGELYGPWLPSSPWFRIVNPMRDHPTVESIQSAVAKHYGIDRSHILSHRRTAKFTHPRQVAYYLCKELTPHSLPQIGRRFLRDHTSALHGIRKIQNLMQKDATLARDIAHLVEKLSEVTQ